jgi:hypothetical protein
MNEAEFNPDVIEAALAHIESNDVRKAYNRSTYLEHRKELMDWWGFAVHFCKIWDCSIAASL